MLQTFQKCTKLNQISNFRGKMFNLVCIILYKSRRQPNVHSSCSKIHTNLGMGQWPLKTRPAMVGCGKRIEAKIV